MLASTSPMTPQERLGEMITRYRVHAHVSQRELAERLAIGPSTLSQYESGARWPRPEHLFLIIKECSLDPRELFDWSPHPTGRLRPRITGDRVL